MIDCKSQQIMTKESVDSLDGGNFLSEGYLCKAFTQALLSMDRVKVFELLEIERKEIDIEMLERLIVTALELVGDGWKEGGVCLAQVYMASRICEEVISFLPIDKQHKKTGQPRMAIGVLEDYHPLGKRIVYSFMVAKGFSLLDYGHGVKTEDFIEKAIADKVEILLISILLYQSALQIRTIRKRLDDAGMNTKLLVGGPPFRLYPGLAQKVGADKVARNASEAVQIIENWMESE